MKVRLFLDSGSYGAWRHDDEISIYDYIEYIKRNQDLLENYVNLDVIPGKHDSKATLQQVNESAVRSLENYKIMREHGLNPIGVFHQGESLEFLQKYLDLGCDYIGIAPTKTSFMKAPIKWFDYVFTYLTDRKGIPFIKTHGFGTGNVKLLTRYPFYSCDSAGWTILASNGKIFVPTFRNNKPQYLKPPLVVCVSDRTETAGNLKVQFGRFSKVEQNFIIKFIEEEVGTTMAKVRYHEIYRRQAMVVYLQKICEAIGEPKPFKYRVKSWKTNGFAPLITED